MPPWTGPRPRSRRSSVRTAQGCVPPTRPRAGSMPGTSRDVRECRARAPGAIIVPAAPPPRSTCWRPRVDFTLPGILRPRPRVARARARHGVKERRAGFSEVVGICFYVPWLSRTTPANMSSSMTKWPKSLARRSNLAGTRVMASARLPRQSPLFNYSHALFRRNCANAARQYTCRGGLCAIRGP